VNTLKSILLLALALMVAANSYSNYQMANAQHTPALQHPVRTAYIVASYELEPVVARSDSGMLMRELKHGLRVNFSLAVILLFTIATSVKEKIK